MLFFCYTHSSNTATDLVTRITNKKWQPSVSSSYVYNQSQAELAIKTKKGLPAGYSVAVPCNRKPTCWGD